MGSYKYVLYDFRSNDFKFMIMAFDEQGNLVKSWERTEGRYPDNIIINETEGTLTFTFPSDQAYQPFTMNWSELIIEEISLASVGVDVASNQLLGTTNDMEYSLNSTNGTDGTWVNASAITTPVTFVAGDVYVRQIALPSNFRKVITIAVAAAAPVAKIAQGTEEGTIKLSGLTDNTEYEYVIDANNTLAGDDSSWANATTAVGAEIDNITVAENQSVHVRVKATANALASEVQTIQVALDNIRSFVADVAAEKAALTLQATASHYVSYNLPTAQYGTTITWKPIGQSEVKQNGSKTAYGTVGDKTFSVSGDPTDTITYEATITKGDVTETKQFLVTVQ